jgi:bifunctional DNA-binding transcriptional regulator/antitoxin component of YhaV-PrlF toxin-antitoxin module
MTMSTEGSSTETTVDGRGRVTIHIDVRRLNVEAGDKLRWTVDHDGDLSIGIVQQRYGAFDGFEAEPIGGDALETHDLMGIDHELGDSEDR